MHNGGTGVGSVCDESVGWQLGCVMVEMCAVVSSAFSAGSSACLPFFFSVVSSLNSSKANSIPSANSASMKSSHG